jgi:large subunit ribosomal protein L21
MYALFELAGFQFRAEEGAVLKIPRLSTEKDKLDISEVLLVQDKDKTLVGTPFVEGAKIQAEIVGGGKDDKIRIYKYKRRTKYRRTQGHRQMFSEIKINKIVAPKN